MAATTNHRQFTMTDRLRGSALIEVFSRAGVRTNIQVGEWGASAVTFWWGFVLLPGWPPTSGGADRAVESLSLLLPSGIVQLAPLLIGGLLLSGQLLAWLGIVPPQRLLRAWLLFAAALWLMTIGMFYALTGGTVGAGIYLIFAAQATVNFRRIMAGD